MPVPPTIDLGSGIDTSKTIQQLMHLERAPLRRLERENGDYRRRIQAWEELRQHTTGLEEKSRDLYSLSGPFGRRQVASSDPAVITGEASSSAPGGNWELELLQLASKHAVHSAAVESDAKLPAARFRISVGKESSEIRFAGGSLADLEKAIQAKGEELLQSGIIDAGQGKKILTIESLKSGTQGRLTFTDPQGLLTKIGLLQEKRSDLLLPFNAAGLQVTNLSQGAEGAQFSQKRLDYEILAEGRTLRLRTERGARAGSAQLASGAGSGPSGQPALRQSLDAARYAAHPAWVNLPAAKPGSAYLKLEIEGLALPPRQLSTKSESLTVGPDISVKVADIELQGDNIRRHRQVSVDSGRSAQMIEVQLTVVYDKKGRGKEGRGKEDRGKEDRDREGRGQLRRYSRSIHPQQGRQAWQIPLRAEDGQPKELIFSADGELFFHNVMLSSSSALQAAHEKSAASDARLKLDGVELQRPDNGPLTDLIEGVGLTLHQPGGPLTIEVRPNREGILKQFQEWVASYNQVVSYLRANMEAEIETDITPPLPSASSRDRRPAAPFVGDSTARQLLSSLNTLVNQSYPSLKKQNYKLLAQVGISTGRPGSNWQEIRSGLLKIDEAKLEEAVNKDSEALRYLVASDSNKDLHFDNGIGFKMETTLKSYNQQTGGLITNRIELLKNSISSNKREKSRRELSLQRKEQNLRERFGHMERSLQKNRRLQQQLRQSGGLPRQGN